MVERSRRMRGRKEEIQRLKHRLQHLLDRVGLGDEGSTEHHKEGRALEEWFLTKEQEKTVLVCAP